MSSVFSVNLEKHISTDKVVVMFKDGKRVNDYVITDKKDLPENAYLVKVVEDVSFVAIIDKDLFKSKRVTPENIKNLFVGISYYKLYQLNLLPKHLKEQFEQRLKDCEPCVVNKKCVLCGCKTPEKLFTINGCPNSKSLIMDENGFNI